jgi:[glutamine synthetase] adenylyltransferase / [glutamine synthetase]-adenylyl-L-tyrosine phosphorylase
MNDWRRELADATPDNIDGRLREMRRELMLRTVVRDLIHHVEFDELVADLTAFADLSVEAALRAHAPRDALGAESGLSQALRYGFSVVAMGKMGGGELNASSDIDVVFVCDEPPSHAMDALNRLANAVTKTLDREIDGEFVFRVDTRLRPYGSVGPIVATLDFLESYFVAHGRMWERIAWLRSRVCAGNAGDALASLVTPFVFRRYLDFDAVSGMRELHAQLRAEKSDPRNIKLGRGGIRELEFGVQLRQLLRGGRDPRMRVKSTTAALAALADAGYVDRDEAGQLHQHYRFLRRVEHVLQYRDDLQTQTLPSNQLELAALAEATGYASIDALEREIAMVREFVARFFDGTLGGISAPATPRKSEALEQSHKRETNNTDEVKTVGFTDEKRVSQFVDASLNGVRARSLPAASRERLARLIDATLQHAKTTNTPDDAATRTLDLLSALASRSSYLALMTERPKVLARVVDLAATSEWAVRYLTTHPLQLDELIDARSLSETVAYDAWHHELRRMLDATGDDTEAGMDALRHFQQAETFRLLLKDIAGQFSVETLSDHLSALADVCVDATLRKLLAAAKLPMHATLTVIAYGKWGSKELGYASDLDLIFLMPNEATEFRDQLTRVAQKLQNWLTTLTSAGRAYEIDVRLRPDGASGLLLSTVDAFATYQRDKAWTWEHQALTRARFAAGNRAIGQAFERVRDDILALPRDWAKLRADILEMRERIAKERVNRDADLVFDLKHDRGGLVDMEFAVQALVLRYGATHETMRLDHGNIALAKRAASLGLLGADGAAIAQTAADAYRELRKLQHAVRLRGAEKARVARDEAKHLAAAVTEFYDRALEIDLGANSK